MTTTFTHTFTKTRIEVVAGEFAHLLLRAGCDEDWAASIAEGVRRRMVKSIVFYAVDTDRRTWGEVELTVDWNEHDRQITAGRVTVSLDETVWKEETSPDVRMAVKLFSQFRTERGLGSGIEIRLTSEVMADPALEAEAERLMNLVDSEKRPWVNPPQGYGGEIDEVPELRLDTRMAERD